MASADISFTCWPHGFGFICTLPPCDLPTFSCGKQIRILFNFATALRQPSRGGRCINLRQKISDLLNIHLSDAFWIQASFPVHWGLLGLRVSLIWLHRHSLHHLILSPLVSFIQPIAMASFDALLSKELSHWSSKCNLSPPSPSLCSLQRTWDDAICSTRMQSLLAWASGADRARLLASSSLLPALGYMPSRQPTLVSAFLIRSWPHGFGFICTPPPFDLHTFSRGKQIRTRLVYMFIFSCLLVFYPGRECFLIYITVLVSSSYALGWLS